jgi:SGNH hydrolase-like domain, acetyltransferase AlgX
MESHTRRGGAATEVDFRMNGNLRNFEHSGFSQQESLGAWSLGTESSILLPRPTSKGDLELTAVVLPCLLEGVALGQSLEILAGGVPVYHGVLTKWTNITVKLAGVTLGEGDTTRLIFRHPTPVVPAHGGNSSDVRPLAIMFRSLTLTGDEADKESLAIRSSDAPARVAAAPFMVSPFLVSPYVVEPARGVTAGGVPDMVAPANPLPSAPSPGSQMASSSDVIIGRNGWLFLIGGSNNALRYYTDASYFTDERAEDWANLLRRRHAQLSIMGVSYLHIGAPDKISAYPDYLDMALPNSHRHPIRLLEERLAASGQAGLLINPLAAFAAHPLRDQLYLKTDTHWTYYAGLVVLEMVMRKLGIFPAGRYFRAATSRLYACLRSWRKAAAANLRGDVRGGDLAMRGAFPHEQAGDAVRGKRKTQAAGHTWRDQCCIPQHEYRRH